MKIDEFQVGALGALNTIYGYTTEEQYRDQFKARRKAQQDALNDVCSINQIRKNPESVNWLYLTVWRVMDETFMREFADYLDWELLEKYQEMSEDFKREMKVRQK